MTAPPIRPPPTIALPGLPVALTVAAPGIGASSGVPGSPSTPPATQSPGATPQPTAPVRPTPAPSEDPGSDAMPITVDLVTADRHDVRVDIVDHSGRLVGARSGQPAEGIS